MELTPLKLAGTVWLAWGVYWFIASRSVKRDASAEPVLRRAQHIALQVLAFLLTFGLVPGVHVGVLPWSVEWVGLLLTVAALALGVWARVHLGAYWSGRITIKEGHQLIRTGPYAVVRHPIYAAILFGMAGAVISSGHLGHLLGPLIMAGAYMVKIRREEAALIEGLPGYADYRREVRALIPFVF
jgi:protein-S-isoprenylcysteine O-methyltransferase Ste14